MIRINSAAKEKISSSLDSPGMEAYYLRLGLSGNACSGKFIIGLDKPTESDETYLVDGIRIVIARKHLMYVAGKEVNYLTENGDSFFALI
jgi:iron-sulfur cluster assembly protein